VWELSTEEGAASKAEKDYVKRTQAAPPNARNITYAAVSTQPWTTADNWASRHQDDGVWKDVIAFNLDALLAWIIATPVVEYWVARLVNQGAPLEAVDVEQLWFEHSHATQTRLSIPMLAAGREDQMSELRQFLEAGSPRAIKILGESRQESLVFTMASILGVEKKELEQYEDASMKLLARSLVVEKYERFRALSLSRSGMILICNFDENLELVPAGSDRGHVIIVPLGHEDGGVPDIRLGPIDGPKLKSALAASGLPEDQAVTVASRTAGSFGALRRTLADESSPTGPLWARQTLGLKVARLMLVGGWDERNAGDREVVAAICGSDLGDVTETLSLVRYVPEAPFTKIGTVWQLRSPRDAWQHLGKYVTDTDLDRLVSETTRVLGERDPRFELPEDKWWMGAVMGKELTHSEFLRKGLAQTAAILGTATVSMDAATGPSQRACQIVRSIWEGASWELWASLDGLLPLLGEACPDEYLNALDVLEREGGQRALLKGSGTDGIELDLHTGLLRSLETLAWSSELLGRVLLALARLAEKDEGGRTGPRPSQTLLGLLVSPARPTSVKSELIPTILDTLRERTPSAAWALMRSMATAQGVAVGVPPTKPEWRPWAQHQDVES